MVLSAAQIAQVLIQHWEALGGGADKPSEFSFMVITKGREPVGKLVLLAFPPGASVPRFAIKVARVKTQNAALEAEYRSLTLVGSHAAHGCVRIPAALLCRDVGGSLVLVESVVDGVELTHAAGARAGRFVTPIVDWLIHLGRATAGLRMPEGGGAENIGELVSRARGHARTEEERRVLAAVSNRLSVLDDGGAVRVFEQRDMGTWNVLVAADGSLGVVDWESSVAHGFPGWDLFYYLAHHGFVVQRSRSREHRLRAYASVFFGDSGLAETAGAAVRRYTEALSLRTEWLLPLLLGCWLHHSLSEATRLGIALSDSLFWHMLVSTLRNEGRSYCWG